MKPDSIFEKIVGLICAVLLRRDNRHYASGSGLMI